MFNSPEVLVENRIHARDVAFYVVQADRFSVSYAQPLVMERVENPHVHQMTPTFTLDHTQAQAVMDRLWQAGFRPSEGSGSAGSLAATQKHLDDMRLIALTQLGIDGKKA